MVKSELSYDVSKSYKTQCSTSLIEQRSITGRNINSNGKTYEVPELSIRSLMHSNINNINASFL